MMFQASKKAYAVQAGRELRVMVKPEEVDDLTAYQIAREIKEKIENELKYPGTIKSNSNKRNKMHRRG